MPFTPAHTVIVLPFVKKKYLSATALVVGSISPDFEYFFKASVSGQHGHSVAGIIYFDLPVTLFLSFLFHLLIKKNLFANLPVFLQQRFHSTLQFNFKEYFVDQYGIIIFSAILGAVSHVFWDSFTHNDAFFVRNLHIYQEIVVPFQGVQYPLFYALQHISTYVGLTILIFYVFLMPVDLSFEPSKPRLQYWLLLAFLGSILFALRFVFTPRHFNLGNAVVTAVSALTLSMCILGYSRMFRPAAPQNSEP